MKMVVAPKTRGFICTTAHPSGCFRNVENMVKQVKKEAVPSGTVPKRVLVIGSSTGYGLAARIALTFGYSADTIGVFFERPASGKRTATAGWYNNSAFETLAKADGRVAKSINGDAYSNSVKEETIQAIAQNLPEGQVDLVIYSLASPRRTDPADGETYSSVIKPIGQEFTSKTLDFHTGEVSKVTVEPATGKEIRDTVKVMGGEDWLLWIKALEQAGVLAENAATVAFSYLGPELTHPVYRDGTIGKAKEDLDRKSKEISALLASKGGRAFVSVNKALVTQSSAAIPVVPLYISLLYQVMKEQGTHEGCLEQMLRMLERLYLEDTFKRWDTVAVDKQGYLRLDDWEMEKSVQQNVAKRWQQVTSDNVTELADLEGYQKEFFSLFGFGVEGIDYQAPVEL